ncbi:hypothetical protein Q7M_1324, partial (plasmid) [Borrelia crocidurae str. Achema]
KQINEALYNIHNTANKKESFIAPFNNVLI